MNKNKDYNNYDIAIIGGGPSGLTSSIYASRYKLRSIIFTKDFGGQMSEAHKVCNYPGFKEITGMQLANRMMEQAKELGANFIYESVVNINKDNNDFVVETEQQSIKVKKVIIAIGLKRRKLNLENEEKFLGKGISYCATCDGNFYKDKITAVIGGSNSAVTAALLLSDISNKVYLIYRKGKLRAMPSWIEQVKKKSNIEVLYNTKVKKLIGKDKLEKIELNSNKTLDIDGLFVEIGSIPNKKFINKLNIDTNGKGYIKVDNNQKTNISGIFAAGDCTNKTDLKQIITSSSQGAIAADSAYKQISENKK